MMIEAPNSPQAPIDVIRVVLGGLDQDGAQLSIIPVGEEETTIVEVAHDVQIFYPSILMENPKPTQHNPLLQGLP